LAKIYSVAQKELLKAFRQDHLGFASVSAKTQEEIAKTVVKFNVINTEEGKSKLFPIGLLALSHLRCIAGCVTAANQQKIASHALSHTLSQLHQEYLKHKIQNPPVQMEIDEEMELGETETFFRDAEDPIEIDHPLETRFEEKPPVVFETKGEPISDEVSDTKKTTEEKKSEKPAKIANSKKSKAKSKSKKKTGFWKSFSNFFKNMFSSISNFFTGKKKKTQK
jgi:hypothetical protein